MAYCITTHPECASQTRLSRTIYLPPALLGLFNRDNKPQVNNMSARELLRILGFRYGRRYSAAERRYFAIWLAHRDWKVTAELGETWFSPTGEPWSFETAVSIAAAEAACEFLRALGWYAPEDQAHGQERAIAPQGGKTVSIRQALRAVLADRGSFCEWLAERATDDDTIGDLARDWQGDWGRPAEVASADCLLGYLDLRGACSEAVEAARDTWREFSNERKAA